MTAAIFGNFTRVNQQNGVSVANTILERLRAGPGVRSAAITNTVPQRFRAPVAGPVQINGRTRADGRPFTANANVASDGYFETLDVPLLGPRLPARATPPPRLRP
jgi:hypothetical protein